MVSKAWKILTEDCGDISFHEKNENLQKENLYTILTDSLSKEKIHYFRSINSLNENGYIIPGMGDAGDRIFNT